MPWTNLTILPNTELADVVGISVTYEDDTDFVQPFTFTIDRMDISTGNRNQLKTRANAALEAERTRRQALRNRETQMLTFMNAR